MIKKTLYFGNPAYLSLRSGQLVIKPAGSGLAGGDHDHEKPPGETTRRLKTWGWSS